MKTTIDYGGKPSDYQTTMTQATIAKDLMRDGNYRLCPLKAARDPVLAFYNVDISGQEKNFAESLGVSKMIGINEPEGGASRVEYMGGQCNGSRCAWYDEMKEQCAILGIARSAARLAMHK
nr:MAG TPA: zinc finger protein [Caudoviricetes sp.]